MNEGQLSAQVFETASVGGSSTQLSSLATELLTQNSTPSSMQTSVIAIETLSQLPMDSPMHLSSLVIEVMQTVPRIRAQLLVSIN